MYDYEIETKEDADIRRELFKRVAARNWIILGLKTSEMTLEDIFLKITMDDSFEIKTKKTSDKKADDAENADTAEPSDAAEAAAEESSPAENESGEAPKEDKKGKKSKKEKSKEAEE